MLNRIRTSLPLDQVLSQNCNSIIDWLDPSTTVESVNTDDTVSAQMMLAVMLGRIDVTEVSVVSTRYPLIDSLISEFHPSEGVSNLSRYEAVDQGGYLC